MSMFTFSSIGGITISCFGTFASSFHFSECIRVTVWILLKLYRDFLHINISAKYDIELSVTVVTFQTRSKSTYIVSTITL